jgi:hypothetical protein
VYPNNEGPSTPILSGELAGKVEVACRQCGACEVDIEEGDLVDGTPLLRLRCRACGEHVRDVRPEEYAFFPTAPDVSRAQQLPLRGDCWWLSLLHGADGTWRPVAASPSLAGAWDVLQHGWASGDVLMVAQRGRLPDVEGVAPGPFALPAVAGGEDETPPGPCRRPGRRVACEVAMVRLHNGYRTVDGVEVTCGRCEHMATCYGQSERSVKRALVLLRESCPREERNFYAAEEPQSERVASA